MTENFQTGPSAPDSEALSSSPEQPDGVQPAASDGEVLPLKPEKAKSVEVSVSDGHASPPKNLLPDGIGIKLNKMAALLSQEHGKEVKRDEPILMMASICNAFLGEIGKLHRQHNKDFDRAITFRTRQYMLAVKATTKRLSPQLPDGIGMTLDEMSALLAMKHGTAVTLNDPVLMVGSICNAFLSDTHELHNRQKEALSKIIAAHTQEYISAVKATTDSFSQAVSTASVEGIRQIFSEHASALESSIWNTRWCALIIAVSALANLIVLAVR
jgi:hypothetical protein